VSEVVSRFATSPERAQLLTGLLDLRLALANLGITNGVQWIDGSFVEDTETIRGRAPADIDVVTLAPRPVPDQGQWRQMVMQNLTVFSSQTAKATFGCDHYFLDLQKNPTLLVADTTYFSGLFGHQRVTSLWKGMLEVPLSSDDSLARVLL
jgi:hypothetical protein